MDRESDRGWWRSELLLDEEGVAFAFAAYGGVFAVAGVDEGFVGELHEFVFEAGHDFVHGAAPEVGAADAAGKERVSGEEMWRGELDFAGIAGDVERDAARGVAGGVDYVHLVTAPAQGVAFFEEMIDFG